MKVVSLLNIQFRPAIPHLVISELLRLENLQTEPDFPEFTLSFPWVAEARKVADENLISPEFPLGG